MISGRCVRAKRRYTARLQVHPNPASSGTLHSYAFVIKTHTASRVKLADCEPAAAN